MKISICDACKSFDDKIVETNKYLRVKGNPFLRTDVCEKHSKEFNSLRMVDYVRVCYKMNGIVLKETDEEIKQKFLVR